MHVKTFAVLSSSYHHKKKNFEFQVHNVACISLHVSTTYLSDIMNTNLIVTIYDRFVCCWGNIFTYKGLTNKLLIISSSSSSV